MKIIQRIENKKKEIEESYGSVDQIKPYKLFKFLIEEIKNMRGLFTKKEQLEIINKGLQRSGKFELTYISYIKFHDAYINIKPKKSEKLGVEVEPIRSGEIEIKENKNTSKKKNVFENLEKRK